MLYFIFGGRVGYTVRKLTSPNNGTNGGLKTLWLRLCRKREVNFKPYDIIETGVIAMRLEEAKILHQGEWTSLRPLSEKEGGL